MNTLIEIMINDAFCVNFEATWRTAFLFQLHSTYLVHNSSYNHPKHMTIIKFYLSVVFLYLVHDIRYAIPGWVLYREQDHTTF